MGAILEKVKRFTPLRGATAGGGTDSLKQLCEMFPMLEAETLQSVLEENEGDLEKTKEMFMPMCTAATREEHQKRPPSSRAGKASSERPQSSYSRDVKELVDWAQSPDVDVQFQAARALADLAMSEDQRPRIVKVGGIPHLIKLLCSAGDDRPELQRCVVMAVANLALSEQNQGLLVDAGVLPPLIELSKKAMTEGYGDVEMQSNLARGLANLAYCNEDLETRVVEQGGLEPLVSWCKSDDEETRLEAFAALANLARHVKNQRKIVEQEGALRELVKAVKVNGQEELLMQTARCLANISLNAENQADLKESGVTAALISAIPKASPEGQRLSGMALANMAALESLQAQMVQEGALPVMFELLQSGSEDIELQAARCVAMLSQNELSKAEIVRQGGLPHFVELARTRTQDMQILAATTLANLSTVKGVSASWG
uniref:Vacuolar protein 8 n=1 Tax=Hemiselmis tepida TaxID=464990 RepID=A0A7S0W446_9CRYP|mmetsp:Transcript_27351/g.69434  ORF Transcript_27351/g.69434 Transcript_27351/m.69434 type:complete len:432 (+) Transcript_27351:151-1446(+)